MSVDQWQLTLSAKVLLWNLNDFLYDLGIIWGWLLMDGSDVNDRDVW